MRALGIGAAIEASVASFNKWRANSKSIRIAVKAICGKGPGGAEPEERSAIIIICSAAISRTIKAAVASLGDALYRAIAIRTVCQAAKSVKTCYRTGRRHPEDIARKSL